MMTEHLSTERLTRDPAILVAEAEYRRLLGYPKNHEPGERVRELSAWARRTFAEISRPWIYWRKVELQVAADRLRLDGVEFRSNALQDHLRSAGAQRAMLAVVSAGQGCEERARALWQDGKPDEYFFLEMFGSAVVEHLVSTLFSRICDDAEHSGLMAIPHYSPGYAGWDVAEQNRLFEVIAGGRKQAWPEPIEVLSSGMLRPKKSLLAVFGLAPRQAELLANPRLVPCEACSFSPCQYRRMAYRHDAVNAAAGEAPKPAGGYTVNPRALRKWAQERVRIAARADGSLAASFRFDGTTCSNMGRPLAFDYLVALSSARDGYRILAANCAPAEGDEGHKAMCSYLADAPALMQAMASEKPLLGRPLHDVLTWTRAPAPTGCHCDASSRAHKWGLALEAIHFALAQSSASSPPTP
jgi:hypothetical protein